MEASELQDTIFDVIQAGRNQGILHRTVEDAPLDGRSIVLSGRELINCGSCSYLGLEVDPRLREGIIKYTERYGSQFSASRTYLSAPPYAALEEQLSTLFGHPTLISSSTTLGHLGAIPVLCQEKDAIILDQQVHHSVQLGVTLARAAGCHVEMVRHGDTAELETRIAALSQLHRRVWYMIDGVYSMHGDLPDVGELGHLLAAHEQLHLYVDDAHGMSIAGLHGRGTHLSRMPMHERMVLATSLNKAFAGSGGCLVFPTTEMRERVRVCGGTFIFCGPLQPPMLGAVAASAAIHLSDEIQMLQGKLQDRVRHLTHELQTRNLPLLEGNDAPIFFVKTGPIKAASALLLRLQEEGFYVSAAIYPAVPLKRSGLRITVTTHHTLSDLTRLAECIERHYEASLHEGGVTRQDVEEAFAYRRQMETKVRTHQLARTFVVSPPAPKAEQPRLRPANSAPLELVTANSISELDAAEWNGLLGQRGTYHAAGLTALESIFRNRPEPENNWKFHYLMVRSEGRPVAATFFTEALWKDDMLMRDEVSRRIEARRSADPYHLTSRAMAMGSLLTEGNHLFLDRTGPWQQAMARLLEEASRRMRLGDCKSLVLRDLPDGDPEFDELMLDLGLVKMPLIDSHHLDLTPFADEESFLKGLSRRTRKRLREEVLDHRELFRTVIYRADTARPSAAQFAHFYDLYRQVKARKYRLNTFDLPRDIFERLFETSGWELMALYLPPEAGGPSDGREVAVVASCSNAARYVAMVCGVDTTERPVSAYRQMLWQLIQRGRARGHTDLELGMDAEYEKVRLGAVPRPQCAYVQLTDHFGAELLGQVVQDVSLGAPAPVRKTA